MRNLLYTLMLIAIVSACSRDGGETPDHLHLLVLPDQNTEALHEQHDPLVNYLQRELGLPVQLVIPDNYEDFIKQFAAGDAELAFFGGLTYIQAHHTHGAEALVMRDIDLEFTSTFIAHKNSDKKVIEDFANMRFSFGSQQSTSGHLMPRHFLAEKGIEPKAFFSQVNFSGSHNKTVEHVLKGEVDIGVANSAIVEKLMANDDAVLAELEILWITPPYPDYVWAAKKGLSQEFKKKLLEAFLQLTPADPENKVILDRQFAGGFLPSVHKDFTQLETIAVSQGFIDGQ